MSEETTPDGPGTDAADQVDLVLASLDALDDLPVSEHVAVFERAHERLRRCLDATPATSSIPDQLRVRR